MVNLSVRNLTRETPETRMRVEEQRQFVLPKAMLAKPGTLNLLNSNNHIAETKWDGTRVFLVKRNGKVRLFVARGKNNEYTQRYRQLVMDGIQTKCNSCVLDGEFLFINKEGRNIFLTMASDGYYLFPKKDYDNVKAYKKLIEYLGDDFVITSPIRLRVGSITGHNYAIFVDKSKNALVAMEVLVKKGMQEPPKV